MCELFLHMNISCFTISLTVQIDRLHEEKPSSSVPFVFKSNNIFALIGTTIINTGWCHRTVYYSFDIDFICNTLSSKNMATLFKLPFFWRRMCTSESRVIHHFDDAQGNNQDPTIPEILVAGSSCILT